MTLSFRVAACLAAALHLAGCADTSLAETDHPAETGLPGAEASIAFSDPSTLTLVPGEIAEIEVVTDPPGRYGVSFALLGEALDGGLSASATVADNNGRAKIRLRAPNGATYFAVRATIKHGPSVERSISVSEHGFGTLSVTPRYGGQRATDLWWASVATGTNCDALAANFPEDPAGPAPISGPVGAPLVLEDVPVGPNLAVFVRAGSYMWGCSDEPDLDAGQVTEVDVKIINRPLDLSKLSADASFDFTPSRPKWDSLLEDVHKRMTSAFGGADLSARLLSAMATQSTDETAFESARASQGWDAAVTNHLIGVDVADSFAGFAIDGMAALPPVVAGSLTAAGEGAADKHVFKLEHIGTVPRSLLEVPSDYAAVLQADPDDTVRLATVVLWSPSRFLGSAMQSQALSEPAYLALANMAEVMTSIMRCDTLPLAGWASCDADCMRSLCGAAVSGMWTDAADASLNSGLPSALQIVGSGAAIFDTEAAVTGFAGSWLGEATADASSVGISGEFSVAPTNAFLPKPR